MIRKIESIDLLIDGARKDFENQSELIADEESDLRFLEDPNGQSSVCLFNDASEDNPEYSVSSFAVAQIGRCFGIRPWVLWEGLSPKTVERVLNELLKHEVESMSYRVLISGDVVRGFVPCHHRIISDLSCLLGALKFCRMNRGYEISSFSIDTSGLRERFALYITETIGFGEMYGIVLYNSEVGAIIPEACPCLLDGDACLSGPARGVRLSPDACNPDGVCELLSRAASRIESFRRDVESAKGHHGFFSPDIASPILKKLGIERSEEKVFNLGKSENVEGTAFDLARCVSLVGRELEEARRVKHEQASGRILMWDLRRR